MANLPISGLVAIAANLAATDVVPVVQTTGVGPVKMTGLQLAGGLLGSTALTGATVTTSQPVLNLSQTWNAGAVTFTGLKFNATDTASSVTSLLADFQTGGASKFSVRKDGITTSGSFTVDTANVALRASSIVAGSASVIGFTSSANAFTTQDVFLRRAAAASLQLGDADAATPVAQTLGVQSVVAGTTNTAGANFTIKGSAGTGTGAGGSIVFQVAPAGSSGTAQNAYATALTITGAGATTIAGNLTVSGGSGINSQGNVYAANYVWGSNGVGIGASLDVQLVRDAANTLALRNGTSAQLFRVYSSYTDAANNAFAFIGAGKKSDGTAYGSVVSFGSDKMGTSGADLSVLEIRVNGTTRLDYGGSLGGTWTFASNAVGPAFLGSSSVGGIGYRTGAGGAVTQATSRTTGVTVNAVCGAITLVSAAGSASYQTFTVTNSTVAATDAVVVSQKSGTDKYEAFVTAVGAGSFDVTFATTGGTTTEQPVFNFAVIKAVAS